MRAVNQTMTKLLPTSEARLGISMIMPRASTVRSLCLLVISMGLLMLYVQVYVEQSRLAWTDHVTSARSRDGRVASATREAVNVTSRRGPVNDESSPPAAVASWDYNWDSYVITISIIY